MIAYLDTHAVIRISRSQARIGHNAARLIQRASLLISPIVLLELEYLYEIGRIVLPAKDIVRKLESEIGVQVCNLAFAAVASVALDEKWTRDAFDRIIVAQARLNGLAPLISSDEEIAEHYPRTVW
ncbi:MAG: PIN domain-containing protein [Terracidiphilus sp.]|jgi:PIN domain nuclease of toxin-antitoxin system